MRGEKGLQAAVTRRSTLDGRGTYLGAESASVHLRTPSLSHAACSGPAPVSCAEIAQPKPVAARSSASSRTSFFVQRAPAPVDVIVRSALEPLDEKSSCQRVIAGSSQGMRRFDAPDDPLCRMPQGLTSRVDQRTGDYRNVTRVPLTALPSNIMNSESSVTNSRAQVHFTQDGSRLKVEIVRDRRSPVIASLHRALFTLGVIVASYQVVSGTMGLVERMVLERDDGGVIDAALSAATQAAILPIALADGSAERA